MTPAEFPYTPDAHQEALNYARVTGLTHVVVTQYRRSPDSAPVLNVYGPLTAADAKRAARADNRRYSTGGPEGSSFTASARKVIHVRPAATPTGEMTVLR